MDFTFSVGVLGIALLVVGSVVLGVALQIIGQPRSSYEWIVTAVGAFVGGFVASELIVDWRGFEPVYDGLALIPALVAGLIIGVAVQFVTRELTGGEYLPKAHA